VATPTGVTVIGGFGTISAAAVAPSSTSAVPEPSGFVLFLAGLAPAAVWLRRKSRAVLSA